MGWMDDRRARGLHAPARRDLITASSPQPACLLRRRCKQTPLGGVELLVSKGSLITKSGELRQLVGQRKWGSRDFRNRGSLSSELLPLPSQHFP
jgi:hypothetical protein